MKLLWVLVLLTGIALLPESLLAQRRGKKERTTPTSETRDTVATQTKAALADYPIFQFTETEFQFGRVVQGALVKHVFRFTNTGGKDLVIEGVKPSCGCTVGDYPKKAIKPGETAEIEVSFNSAGKIGPQTKSVTVTANTTPAAVVLTLQGEVYSELLPERRDGNR